MTMMRKNAGRFLTRIARDRRGVSIIETALIAPVIIMLLAGSVDLAMGFSFKLKTQQAAARSIEYATTRGLENLSEQQLQDEAAAAAKVPSNQVDVNIWLECDGVAPETGVDCTDEQSLARYVSVRIENSYEPLLGPLLPASIAKGGAIEFFGFSSARLQ
jgi:Flp pilus assembly protein TadG